MTRLKDEEGYSFASLNTSLAAITLFFTMNDIIVNRKKIGKYLGEHIKTIKDRGYTHDEIKKMLDVSDLKFKVFITLMASTGCRVGAIPSLKIRNLKYYPISIIYTKLHFMKIQNLNITHFTLQNVPITSKSI